MTYKVRLPVFEGPLELLLHLIEKAQVDIYDIPIALITEQYLEYIRDLQHFDMEVASEFLVMAATLLQIKSRMLLPKPPKPSEPDETVAFELDPRQELVKRLIEYKQYKRAAQILAAQQKERMKIFSREPVKGPWNEQVLPLEGLSLENLLTAFAALLHGQEEAPALIEREEYTVQDKMQEILRRVTNRAGEGLSFKELFYSHASRSEKITCFLALLELIRLRLVKVQQVCSFGEITLFKYIQRAEGE